MERKLSELTDITLKMIIDEGIITPDTVIYSNTKPVKSAKINSTGCIVMNIQGSNKQFPYPSGAARALVKLSVNGWKFLKIKINNELKDISELRNVYKERKK